MTRFRAEYLPLFLLFFAAAYYCHRVYGAFFILEGDAFFHVYFRLYEKMMWADHNPFQWYFSTLISGVGLLNPVLLFVNFLFRILPIEISEVARAVAANMVVSGLSTWLLSVSVYALLRYLLCSRLASTLGALIVSYTGLHLSGIREFDYVFQSSFMFVGPVLICFFEICQRKEKLNWAIGLAICVGCSLLGGGNLPMFQYLPFCFALPLIQWAMDKDRSNMFRSFAWLAFSLAMGFLISAPAVLPTTTSLQSGNRVEIQFDHIAHSLSPWLKFLSLFLRDWFRLGIIHLHERDYFLGLPIVSLVVCGLYSFVRKPSRSRLPLAVWAMLLFLFASFLITHFCYLPELLKTPIAAFYNRLSMRNSNRFFLLGLLPAAYFAAVGFDRLKGKIPAFILLSLSLINLALFAFVLVPDWPRLIPDIRNAALLSLSCAFLASGVLWARWMAFEMNWKVSVTRFTGALAVTLVFGMYTFAPQQLTSYLAHYINEPGRLKSVSADRLQWRNLLALTFNYSDVIAQAKTLYLDVPKFLQKPELLSGRILDEAEFKSGGDNRRNLFAPHSGHRFGFTLLRDHLSSKKMQDIALLSSPAIFDLNGICWVIPDGKNEVVARKSCLPEVYFVPGLRQLGGSASVLNWMAGASREDFQRNIGIDCTEIDCAGLTKFSNFESKVDQENTTKILEQVPGKYVVEVSAKQSGFVFISTHYRSDWVATVNGVPGKVLRANHAFLAVPVERGRSLIELKLTPKLRGYSIPVSILTVLTLIAMLLRRQSIGLKTWIGRIRQSKFPKGQQSLIR